MSDLVERVARAIYEEDDPWHKAWPWPDLQSDQAGVDQYRRIAQAAIAAMQTDATPALKPAVTDCLSCAKVKPDVEQVAARLAAQVGGKFVCRECGRVYSRADRAAIIAAKDAEIAALKGKLAEDNADLPTFAYFAGAADARDRLAALQAHADALAEYAVHQPDCRIGQPDCLGEEELCTCGLSNTLRAYEEFRR